MRQPVNSTMIHFLAEPLPALGTDRWRMQQYVDGVLVDSYVNHCECSAKTHVDDFRDAFPEYAVTFTDRTVH